MKYGKAWIVAPIFSAAALLWAGCTAEQSGATVQASEACAAASANWKKCLNEDFPPTFASACGTTLDADTAKQMGEAKCESLASLAQALPDVAVDSKADQSSSQFFWDSCNDGNLICNPKSCDDSLFVDTVMSVAGGSIVQDPINGDSFVSACASPVKCVQNYLRDCQGNVISVDIGVSQVTCPNPSQVYRPSGDYPGRRVCLPLGKELPPRLIDSAWCDSLPGERNQCAAGLTCINPRGTVSSGIAHGYCGRAGGVGTGTQPGLIAYNGECHKSAKDRFLEDNGQCQVNRPTGGEPNERLVCRPTASRNFTSAATGYQARYCLQASSRGNWCDTNEDCQQGLTCKGGGGSINSHGVCDFGSAELDRICSRPADCAGRANTDRQTACLPRPGRSPNQVDYKTCQLPLADGSTCSDPTECASSTCRDNRCINWQVANGF